MDALSVFGFGFEYLNDAFGLGLGRGALYGVISVWERGVDDELAASRELNL